MQNRLRLLCIAMVGCSLSSCMEYDESYTSYSDYSLYTYDNQGTYPVNYYESNNTYPNQVSSYQKVSVPDSYHVGEYHSPVSVKDVDKGWVSSQNPNGYTIEIANDQKASKVAQTLVKVPKNNRMAQVKASQQGKVYYKGLYGTYSTQEEAKKALDQLPDEVKKGAGIQNWGHVQADLNE